MFLVAVCHNMIKTLPIQCHSIPLRKKHGRLNIKKIWNEVESQLLEKMTAEPIKREGRYANAKLKTWKERIKANFHSQDTPYNMHCNAMAVLKLILYTNKAKIIIHKYM